MTRSPRQRAEAAHDRVHRQGANAMRAAGMHADVVDPSFGDNYRQIRHRLPNGYEVALQGPASHVGYDSDTRGWDAVLHPPGIDYHVGGHDLHWAQLGVFHPRELPARVQAYVQHPDVQAAMQADERDPLKHLEREATMTRVGPFITAHTVGGVEGLVEHMNRNLGSQFGEQ